MERICPACGRLRSADTVCGCQSAVAEEVELVIENDEDEAASPAPAAPIAAGADEAAPAPAEAAPAEATPAPPAQPKPPAARPRRRLFGAVVLSGGAAMAAVFLLLCTGVFGYFGYQRFWNTPDRALRGLVEATRLSDMPEARRYVDPALWPGTNPLPDPALLRAAAHFTGMDDIPWTTRTQEAAASEWSEPVAVPELGKEGGVWLEKRDGRWLVVRYAAGWGADMSGPARLLREMREAADERDGAGFLERVRAGRRTCEGRDCRALAEKIGKGGSAEMLEVVTMPEITPGSLRVTEEGGEVVVRWLRKTRFLGQEGLHELRFAKEDGRWMVTAADGSNFTELDEEMDTWTENHGEMLWRARVAVYVEVKSLEPFCEEWYYGTCMTQVLPTEVKNIGTQKVTSIKVSKVRARRYMGQSSQTLWGIWKNLSPGDASSLPNTVSPPVKRLRASEVFQTWEFYRVEWIELESGERLEYSTRDYREAANGTLVFSEVRASREVGGLSTEVFQKLAEERAAAGYPDSP